MPLDLTDAFPAPAASLAFFLTHLIPNHENLVHRTARASLVCCRRRSSRCCRRQLDPRKPNGSYRRREHMRQLDSGNLLTRPSFRVQECLLSGPYVSDALQRRRCSANTTHSYESAFSPFHTPKLFMAGISHPFSRYRPRSICAKCSVNSPGFPTRCLGGKSQRSRYLRQHGPRGPALPIFLPTVHWNTAWQSCVAALTVAGEKTPAGTDES